MSAGLQIAYDPSGLDKKTAAALDDIVASLQTYFNRGILNASSYLTCVQPRCRYYLESVQVIADNTETDLLWTTPANANDPASQTVHYDNGELFSPRGRFLRVSGQKYLTMPLPGLYLVMASVTWEGHNTGNRKLIIDQRGISGITFRIAHVEWDVSVSVSHAMHTAGVVWVRDPGDGIEDAVSVKVYQSSGGDLDAMSGIGETNIQIIKLS